MEYDVIIIGAGPGGLSCAAYLASHCRKTLVVERSAVIGKKTCAGGITWNGLIVRIPETLIEADFPQQTVVSRRQHVILDNSEPIIATVDRQKLGRHMARQAEEQGAEIRLSTSLRAVSLAANRVTLVNHASGEVTTAQYRTLVGADGSSSRVRRCLGIPVEAMGLGINYQPRISYGKMEWHLDNRYFANGYAWIFPHRMSVSTGAYIPGKRLSPAKLKHNFCAWARQKGLNLSGTACTAGFINLDFRGLCFGNVYLVGDAAGLASALTGEGIYPAICSGEAVGEMIITGQRDTTVLQKMMRRQKAFAKLTRITESSGLLSAAMAELGVLGLRTGLIDFSSLEMA